MVLLNFLATVNIQLTQAKKNPDIDTAIFGGLAIVILMGDFYQFLPVVGKPLWKKAINDGHNIDSKKETIKQ